MDWAGTAIDFGCFAPLDAFSQTFSIEKGIDVTVSQIREKMGMLKIEHIRAILSMPEIAEKFLTKYGRPWDDDDVKEINAGFEKRLFASLADFSTPIDGVVETINLLRARGLKIGSTTGYTDEMMKIVCHEAARNGYVVDAMVTPTGMPSGRPAPFMIHENMKRLNIASVEQVVKVGDTLMDIQEGLQAKCWSIGVIKGSSELGFSEEEMKALPEPVLAKKMEAVRLRMKNAGAHFVLDTIKELPACIDKINEQLECKEKRNYLLLTPGPLSTAQTVREAMLQDWCTWDDDYNVEIVQNIRGRLVGLAAHHTELYTSVLLQGSGTYSVEATIVNAVPVTGKLLILSNGIYGDRMADIARYAGLNYAVLACEQTEVPSIAALERFLQDHADITHIAFVHCETTSGILNPLVELCRTAKKYGKTLIVDAMSSFGGIPFDMEELGIDFMVSSANKCIEGVPGFGFIIARRDHIERCKGNSPSLSLDIYDQWETMEKQRGKWRYTSPTHTVRAFKQALDELDAEGGINARNKRYRINQQILRDGMEEMGYKSLIPYELQSPIITSFEYPAENFSFRDFYAQLKKAGFVIYPGKISKMETFRIGTIGQVFPDDIKKLLEIIKKQTKI